VTWSTPSTTRTTRLPAGSSGSVATVLYYETLQFHGVGQAGLTSVDLTLRSGNPADEATYRDTLSLTRSTSRWYLILGWHR
jgi:hypothetical protein